MTNEILTVKELYVYAVFSLGQMLSIADLAKNVHFSMVLL
jgi:hypothetical protein